MVGCLCSAPGNTAPRVAGLASGPDDVMCDERWAVRDHHLEVAIVAGADVTDVRSRAHVQLIQVRDHLQVRGVLIARRVLLLQ